jgi:hypothetical protein|tara:strand:+ start:491 stop:700 length:210 start_codon:yes stop_codon:yes gene_type:complete
MSEEKSNVLTIDRRLVVKKKSVWGTERIYPVCEKSILFARLCGQKTLDKSAIVLIRQLGYDFKHEEISI